MNIWNDEVPGYKELLYGELQCDDLPDWDEMNLIMVASNRNWFKIRWDVLRMWFIFHICGTDLLSHNWDVEEDGDAENGPSFYAQCLRCYDEQGGA